MSIGICGAQVNLNRLCGWEPNSIGYHGDDGMLYRGAGSGSYLGPGYTTGDTVGCGVDFSSMGTVFFTKNGILIGKTPLPPSMKQIALHASIGLRTPGECLLANFGERPFVFDLRQYVLTIRESMAVFSSPDADDLVLVLNYLIHSGYEEAATSLNRSFAEVAPSQAYSPEVLNQKFAESRQRCQLVELVRRGLVDEAISSVKASARWDQFPPRVHLYLQGQSMLELLGSHNGVKDSKWVDRMMAMGRELHQLAESCPDDLGFVQDVFSMVAYEDPAADSPTRALLSPVQRDFVADLMEGALLGIGFYLFTE